MTTAVAQAAQEFVDSGDFYRELQRLVTYETDSTTESGKVALAAYLSDVLVPTLEELGCTIDRFDRWRGGDNSFLVGTRHEGDDLPTLLCYGHADVVPGQPESWTGTREPWNLTDEGGKWYGRGAADNKGQHLVNLTALRLILEEKGRLGFNLKFLFEGAEEVGSPELAEFAAHHSTLLSADVFIGSDGPRLDASTPTLFLGNRGRQGFDLTVRLREGAFHSGNWGGVLRNPATVLAAAISALVDGRGVIQVPALLPAQGLPDSVREVLSDIRLTPEPEDPRIDDDWGDSALTPAERVFAWNTLEVVAFGAGDPQKPVNAIPGVATASLQLRYVTGTEIENAEQAIRAHLDQHGFTMVDVRADSGSRASRTEPDNPWVGWAARSVERTTGAPPAILPNIGGTLPNSVFEAVLGLPTIWIPHSYPGCRQHGPDEHMLESIAVQGLHIVSGLFQDLGEGIDVPPSAATL